MNKSYYSEVHKKIILQVNMLHYYHFKIHKILTHAYGLTI